MKTNIIGLSHIALYIKDLEVSKKFYTEVLGFEILGQTTWEGDTLVAWAKRGNVELELVQLPRWEDRPDGLWDHVSMEVDDIAAAKEELVAKGIEFEREIEPGICAPVYGGVYYLMFRGPDGERLEINQFTRPRT
ncbi:MAG: VOC family protein [Christensenellaceae bacterium]|nr:VOC family protein [Christensenellaceae bacterium]